MDIRWVEYMFGSTDDDLPQLSDRELASELRAQLTVLVAVARFNRKYDKCAAEYRTRAGHLARELLKRGLPDPNPYATPQDWWRWYKDQHIDTVQEREVLLNRMFASTLTVLEAGPHALPRPSTWPDIETRVTAARSRLAGAVSEVQFQEVGLNCRELLLALAKIVYDPTRHTSSDGVAPSNADSKRQLDAYMLSTLRGNANEVTRKFAKAAIDLANQLTHRATSTLHDAALCLEASVAVVSIVAIISGRLG
jgi:hypothetical protein